MIARNEARHIGRCLASARKYVDEIIINDTGSTDNTVEIAKNMGALVVENTWCDDFSLARNQSLDKASGDWIIFLDCDEEMTPEDGHLLKQVVAQDDQEAFFVTIVNRAESSGDLDVPSVRIFRNRPGYRFEGSIHEQILPAIVRQYSRERIGYSGIRIIHHGYDPQMVNIAAKTQRNLSILLKYDDKDKNGFYYFNLGSEFLRAGQAELALEHFEKALADTPSGQSYAPMLIKKTMTALLILRRYQEAIRRAKYYQTILPDYTDLYLWEAISHIKCGRFTSAWQVLQFQTNHTDTPWCYPQDKTPFGFSIEQLWELAQRDRIDKANTNLSVCILGENEAEILAETIKSVNELADEVYYFDMQSTDPSASIASEHGARVITGHWPQDIHALLQLVGRYVKGQWVLLLKGDEILPRDSRDKLLSLLSTPNPACIFPVHTGLSCDHHETGEIKGECRLFRADRALASWWPYADPDLPAADVPIVHLHYQLSAEYIARKALQAEKRLSGWSDASCEYWARRGKLYYYSRQYESAVQSLTRSMELNRGLPDTSILCYLGWSLGALSHYAAIIQILQPYLYKWPDNKELKHIAALAHYQRGDYEEARLLLEQCLIESVIPWKGSICRSGTGTYMTRKALAAVYIRQEQPFKAWEHLNQAAIIPGAFVHIAEDILDLADLIDVDLAAWMQGSDLWTMTNLSRVIELFALRGRYKECFQWLDLAGELARRQGAGYDQIIGIDLNLLRQIQHRFSYPTSLTGPK